MNEEVDLSFSASNCTIEPNGKSEVRIEADSASISEILEHFSIEEVISHFGETEFLNTTGKERAIEYWELG